MALAKFKSGSRSQIATAPTQEGTIYFATDTQEIAADIPGKGRIFFTSKNGDGDKTTFKEISNNDVDAIFEKYF